MELSKANERSYAAGKEVAEQRKVRVPRITRIIGYTVSAIYAPIWFFWSVPKWSEQKLGFTGLDGQFHQLGGERELGVLWAILGLTFLAGIAYLIERKGK